MKKYEYRFVQVPAIPEKTETEPSPPFDACRKIICDEAARGWRLKQVLEPRMSIYGGNCYQIIFERETE